MRVCIYCRRSLVGQTRAREHVLRQEWLKVFEAGNQKLNLDFFRGPSFAHTREMTALGLQAGEVCKPCNNGWMNDLDRQVSHLLLPLAKQSRSAVPNFTRREAKLVGRWILKVAAAFEATAPRDMRHMPRNIVENLRRPGFLPTGFFLFGATSISPMKKVGITMSDVWSQQGGALVRDKDQSTRLKFALQYDNLILACGYVTHGTPTFSVPQFIHTTLCHNDARVEWRYATFDPRTWCTLPPNVAPSWLNYFLSSVGLSSV